MNGFYGFLAIAFLFVIIFVAGAWSVACSFEEQVVEEDNPPLIPSMFNCLRNRVFRVLLLNQLVEAIGDSFQFTVLPFMVDSVIDPEFHQDGSPVAGGWTTAGVLTLFSLAMLGLRLLSVPAWLKLVHEKGKYKTYLIWNVALIATTALKIFIGHHDIYLGLAIIVLWGLALGGHTFILRSMLADVYEYDTLVTGEKREGQFGVYIDFFGEKLPSIPGEVIPLMLMGSMGYVANQHPQNDEVIWVLRLCFSIVPALTGLLALPVLLCLYPDAAKDDKAFLEEVQAGLARHAKGLEARDPITGNVLPVPSTVHTSCDPRVAAGDAEGIVQSMSAGWRAQSQKRGKAAMRSLDHFTQWELRQVVESGSKGKLVMLTAAHTAVSLIGIILLLIWAARDWTNLDVRQSPDRACTALHSPGQCSAVRCSAVQTVQCGLTELGGLSCSGHGVCNATSVREVDLIASCTCDAGYKGASCEFGPAAQEPVAWLPIIVAMLALFVVYLCVSLLRLKEALRLRSTDEFSISGTDHLVAVATARLAQIQGKASPLHSNIEPAGRLAQTANPMAD